jgi:AcrR family transcriptional regulator
VALVPYRDTRRPGRRAPLDREQVVRAAVALLDEEGLDGISMRALASRLGVKAASLYRHVRDKEELLTLMADELSAEIPYEVGARGWREAMKELARRYRRALQQHRDAARLMAATPPSGPRRLKHVEVVLQVLLDAGLGERDAARAAYHANNFITEFAADEARMAATARTLGMTRKKMMAMGERMFRSLPPSEFPALTRLAGHLMEDDPDGLFEFGLDLLLDGLEPRRRGPGATRPSRAARR